VVSDRSSVNGSHDPRFHKPPCDPGRSVFPSPVLTLAFPSPPSHEVHDAYRLTPNTSRTAVVGHEARPLLRASVILARSPGPAQNRQVPRAPSLRWRYPSVIATASSCASPPPSHGLSGEPWSAGLRRLLSAPAGRRTFPTLSLWIFPQMPGPLPWRSPRCSCSLLPLRHRPSPRSDRVGTHETPYSDFSTGFLSRLQSFAYVQASSFACPPGRSHRRGNPLGGQDVDVWAHFRVVTFSESRPASHPNRAIDGVETFTPPNPQPCRLLPERQSSAAAACWA
jgi:hypothetical protein